MRSMGRVFVSLVIFMGNWGAAIQAEEGSLISRQRAVEIGNHHLAKMKIDLLDLDLDVDEDNKRWNEFMWILRDSPDLDARRQFQRYERRLRGHSYWSLYYRPKRDETHGFKGGGATVLVDSKTGRVLLVIRGE